MSVATTLFALVIVQGPAITIEPGYTSLAECTQQYRGTHVGCYAYDPSGVSWTAFFGIPELASG